MKHTALFSSIFLLCLFFPSIGQDIENQAKYPWYMLHRNPKIRKQGRRVTQKIKKLTQKYENHITIMGLVTLAYLYYLQFYRMPRVEKNVNDIFTKYGIPHDYYHFGSVSNLFGIGGLRALLLKNSTKRTFSDALSSVPNFVQALSELAGASPENIKELVKLTEQKDAS